MARGRRIRLIKLWRTKMPIDAIRRLIDVISGKVPFDLWSAVTDVSTVLQYLSGLFGKDVGAKAALTDEELAAVKELVNLSGEVQPAGLFDSLSGPAGKILLTFLTNWLASKLAAA